MLYYHLVPTIFVHFVPFFPSVVISRTLVYVKNVPESSMGKLFPVKLSPISGVYRKVGCKHFMRL